MMELTKEESACLRGLRGEARAMLYKAIVAYGEAMGATRLADISSTPPNIVFALPEKPAEILRRFDLAINSGVVSKYGFRLGLLEAGVKGARSFTERLTKLGALPKEEASFFPEHKSLYGQCVPFSVGPGQVYASSILGAYCNPLPGLIAIFSSLIGKVPLYGHAEKENRRAALRLTLSLEKLPDPAALGIAIAHKCGDKVAYVVSLKKYLPPLGDDRAIGYLRTLCGALYECGIDLVHFEGYGKEAREKGESLLLPDWEEASIKTDDVIEAGKGLCAYQKRRKKAVVLGAPELSLGDMYRYTAMLRKGARLSKKGKLLSKVYFNASPKAISEFGKSPEGEAYRAMGGKLISYDLRRGVPVFYLDRRKVLSDDIVLAKQGFAYASSEKAIAGAKRGGRL